MKKVLALILTLTLILLTLTSCNNPFMRPRLSDDVSLGLADIAIAKIQEINSEFTADAEDCYVAKSKSTDKWFCYVYSNIDRAFGYEVYYEDGEYVVNYNDELHKARLALIKKMDELMPFNWQLNAYVEFNPYGLFYKTTTRFGVLDGVLAYTVLKDAINIDEQLSIDYELFKFSNQLLSDMGFDNKGIRVRYYEGNKNIKVKNDNNLFGDADRSLSFASMEVYKFDKGLKEVFEYHIQDETLLSKLLESKEEFINYAKWQTTYLYCT